MKILSTVLLASLVCTSAFAKKGKVESFTLADGTQISVNKDIQNILISQDKKIEQIELNNGQIVYDFEVSKVKLKIDGLDSLNISINDIKFQRESKGSTVLGTGDGSGGG